MREERSNKFDWTTWITWVLLTTLGWLVGWVILGELWIGLAVGSSQWVLLRSRLENAYWWILASLIGWALGHLIVINLLAASLRGWAGLPIGTVLGMAQWVILRTQVPRAGWWVVISALGWMLAMTGVLGGSLVGAVAGAATGVAIAMLLEIREVNALLGDDPE